MLISLWQIGTKQLKSAKWEKEQLHRDLDVHHLVVDAVSSAGDSKSISFACHIVDDSEQYEIPFLLLYLLINHPQQVQLCSLTY